MIWILLTLLIVDKAHYIYEKRQTQKLIQELTNKVMSKDFQEYHSVSNPPPPPKFQAVELPPSEDMSILDHIGLP